MKLNAPSTSFNTARLVSCDDVPLSIGAFSGDVIGLGKTYQAIVYISEVSVKPL